MFVNPVIRFCDRVYGWVICLGEHLQSAFLLLIRLIWGHQFFVAGYGKFTNYDQITQFFASLGIPLSEFTAVLIGLLELIGGACLFIGFSTRLFSLFLAIVMIFAIGFAHHHVFNSLHFIMDPSILVREAPFPFLVASLATFIFGPGKVSLDAWIKRSSKNWRHF